MKTKKPILLISIIVPIILIVIGINMTGFISDPEKLRDIKAPNAEALEKIQNRPERQKQYDDAQRAALENAVKIGTLGGGKGQLAVGGVPREPSILLPDSRSRVPEYDENITAGQWYDDDAYMKKELEDD